jgi:hypothetical protein
MLLAVLALLVAASPTNAVATPYEVGTGPAHSVTAGEPACTSANILQSLRRTYKSGGPFRRTYGVKCADGWAVAFVLVGSGNAAFESTNLFRARGGMWVPINRSRPCKDHSIPKKLYQMACFTN